jgi:hypothetical protein
MRGIYTEAYRGKTETRTEHPMNTHHWLARRTEKAQQSVRTAVAQLATAEREGAKPRDLRLLKQTLEDARGFAVHAAEMQRAFAKRWLPGQGYLDPADWESNAPTPVALAGKSVPLAAVPDEKDIDEATAPDEPMAGPRALLGEEKDAEPPPASPGIEPSCNAKEQALPPFAVATGPASADSSPPDSRPPDSREFCRHPSRAESDAPLAQEHTRPKKGPKNTPPDEFKFKKGQPSPNPRGRPRGSRNIKTVVAEVGKITTKTVKNGKRRTVNAIEAAMQVQLGKALGGDTRAYLALMRTMMALWTEAAPEKKSELSEEERRILTNSLALRRLLGEDDET